MREYLRAMGQNPPERVSVAQLKEWLGLALKHGDPVPSDDALEKLALGIVLLTEGPGAVDAEERAQECREELLRAAANLRAAWLDYWPAASEASPFFVRTFSGVDEMLQQFGIVARRTPVVAKRGRPEERWHAYGHKLADLISKAMREAGYRRSLSKQKEHSVTAVVGASLVEYFFKAELKDMKLDASGFAAAMRPRRRDRSSAH